MNAQLRPADIAPKVVPMTVTALALLDENGFFDGDPNDYELIDGVLVMTPPPGSGHNFVELKANRVLVRAILRSSVAESHAVQTGGSFQIGEQTLLGPDLMIVAIPNEPTMATAETIITMIEIAWSSRANELGPKAKLYAAAGVADYWVLDAVTKSVIVHRDPVEGFYTSIQTLKVPERVACLKLPQISTTISNLF